MTSTDFYNLSQHQQKAERLNEYRKFFENIKTKADYENKQRIVQGTQADNKRM